MKAIVQNGYGSPLDVLTLHDTDEPAVTGDAALVRARAASTNPADWHMVRGEPRIARLQVGLRHPKRTVPGFDAAGEVVAVGEQVTDFKPGNAVFGCTFVQGFGTFAEFTCAPAEVWAAKPANVSFEQAAAAPLAALTALQGLRDHGRLRAGSRVLIVGAAGGVGTFAVQIAKALGAEVTGVCSTRNAELVRSLGAEQVIDYTREDFTKGGERYDLIFQLAGTLSASDLRPALTATGTLVLCSGESSGRWIGPVARIARAQALAPFVSQRIVSFLVKPRAEDLRWVADLIADGRLTPVIDREYALAETPQALAYLEQGHARGKVVISLDGAG